MDVLPVGLPRPAGLRAHEASDQLPPLLPLKRADPSVASLQRCGLGMHAAERPDAAGGGTAPARPGPQPPLGRRDRGAAAAQQRLALTSAKRGDDRARHRLPLPRPPGQRCVAFRPALPARAPPGVRCPARPVAGAVRSVPAAARCGRAAQREAAGSPAGPGQVDTLGQPVP